MAALAVAALVAVIVAMSGDDSSTTDAEATAFDRAEATVDGTPLPVLPEAGDDPAVGRAAPVLQGQDLDGGQVTQPTSGRPTIILFLAHWCPHCQREVPLVQEWSDAGQLPEDVDLVAVATGITSSRPNYPPSAWLEREHWTAPTIADASGAAAEAYGLSAFPFWVAVDAQGTVVERRTGELSLAEIEELAAAATSP